MERKKIKVDKPITLDRGFDEFIQYCKARNLRTATIKFYENSIKSIYKAIDYKTPIESINKSTLDSFILFYRSYNGINEVTLNTYLRALKTLLRYFMRVGYMEKFDINMVKFNKPIIETYTDSEIKLLLKKPESKNCSFVEYRNYVICNLLFSTGIRCSNILNLKIEDIDMENNLIFLRTTKNRNPLIVPLVESMKIILKYYINLVAPYGCYLFPTAYGNQMQRNTLESSLRSYNRTRGVIKTGIHRWRHTFAKCYIKNGGNAFKLQKLLGHSSLEVTKNYINLFTDDLLEDNNKFNPLEKLINNKIKIGKK